MSNEELDDLFKHKLETLKTPPSPSSWQEVERRILKQNAKKPGWPIYTKVAAAVLILMVFSGVMIKFISKNEQDIAIITGIEIVKPGHSTAVNECITEELMAIKTVPKEVRRATLSEMKAGNPIKNIDKSTAAKSAEKKPTVTSAEQSSDLNNDHENEVKHLKSKTEMVIAPGFSKSLTSEITPVKKIPEDFENVVVAENTQPRTGRKLTFNLDDFSTRNSPEIHVNQSEETIPQKGLKKIAGLAKTIKEGKGLAELRAAKNELLAFNSKKKVNENVK